MLVFKNAKICVTPNAKPKICVSPNAKPKRKSVEYRLLWVPNAKFWHWPCTFHFFCVNLIRVGSRFFSGIWALMCIKLTNVLLFMSLLPEMGKNRSIV